MDGLETRDLLVRPLGVSLCWFVASSFLARSTGKRRLEFFGVFRRMSPMALHYQRAFSKDARLRLRAGGSISGRITRETGVLFEVVSRLRLIPARAQVPS